MSRPKASSSFPNENDTWEKEADVRALARAHAIKKDPVRHKKALHHARTMKAEHAARMNESKAIVDMANKPVK